MGRGGEGGREKKEKEVPLSFVPLSPSLHVLCLLQRLYSALL